VLLHLTSDGEPIYYNGPYKIWKIASGPQIIIDFVVKFSAFVCLTKIRREKLCQGARDATLNLQST